MLAACALLLVAYIYPGVQVQSYGSALIAAAVIAFFNTLVRPVLAVIFMLSFIGTYGDYMLAKIMLSNTQKYTVAVGLSLFIGQQYGQRWGEFAAGAILAAIPTMILFYISQSQLQSGLTAGAVKG